MMENVLAFLRAAAPWISLGLLVAFFCVRATVKKGKSKVAEGDYVVNGMCIGMVAGSLIGDGNGGLGTSLGMLIGLAVGLCITRT